MRGEPHASEGTLPDLVSGLMWLASGVFGPLALALPGSSHDHVPTALTIAGLAIAWGMASLVLAARGAAMPIGVRALVTAIALPFVGVALWATGGATSFLAP